MTTDRTSTWLDEVAHWLIHRAAQHAPEELSERLAEEWRADLGGRRPGLARLRFALGCSWATRVIALDRSRAALSVSAAGQGSTSGYFGPDTLFLSRRYATFLLVVGLHGAVLCGLIMGITITFPKVIEAPLSPYEVPREPHPLPQPPAPQREQTRIELPALDELRVAQDTDATDRIIPDLRPAEPLHSTPTHVVGRVIGGPGAGFPNTGDFYPSASIFAREQGAAAITVCVDPKGDLTADPTVAQSSGIARLDQAALRLARAGSGHYRPSTEDGKPVSGCYAFRIRFDLR